MDIKSTTAMASGTCMIRLCNVNGSHQTFRVQGINKLIQCSKERGDIIHIELQTILDSQGELASVECHKTCYCTYTSNNNVTKHIARKQKQGFSVSESEPQTTRVRRSELPTFQFNKHCLICGSACLPKDPKHPR